MYERIREASEEQKNDMARHGMGWEMGMGAIDDDDDGLHKGRRQTRGLPREEKHARQSELAMASDETKPNQTKRPK